jgi:hypothetical protein
MFGSWGENLHYCLDSLDKETVDTCRKSLLKDASSFHWPLHPDVGETFYKEQTHFMSFWHESEPALHHALHNNLGNLLPTTMSSTDILESQAVQQARLRVLSLILHHPFQHSHSLRSTPCLPPFYSNSSVKC